MPKTLDVTQPRADLEAELLRRHPVSRNPMVRKHGPGPEGRQCRECRFMITNRYGLGVRFYKCALRGVSASAATDHRLSWPTCGKFEEAGNG